MNIYNTNSQPTHAVVISNNLRIWGNSAAAISHHWTVEEAESAAARESADRKETCVVIVL